MSADDKAEKPVKAKAPRKSMSADNIDESNIKRSPTKFMPLSSKSTDHSYTTLSAKDTKNKNNENSTSLEKLIQDKHRTVQRQPCFEYASSLELACCRECSSSATDGHVAGAEANCRFYGWRKVDEASGRVAFLAESEDAQDADRELWSLPTRRQTTTMTTTTTTTPITAEDKFLKIFWCLVEPFEKILSEEMSMRDLAKQTNKRVHWKRFIEQTRESCDQCKTHIFNGHFVCPECGFAVCLDCFDCRYRDKAPIGESLFSVHRGRVSFLSIRFRIEDLK